MAPCYLVPMRCCSLLLPALLLLGAGCTSESGQGARGASGAGGGAGGQASEPGGQAGSVPGVGGTSTAGGSGQAGVAAVGGGGVTSAGGESSSAGAPVSSGPPVVFVGGFGSAPIEVFDLDVATGALVRRPATIDAGPEPTCLAVDPSGKNLYVCNEDDEGGITSYGIGSDGALTFLNHRAASDSGFTSLAVHPSGKLIAGASYGGGSASVFRIAADGSVGEQLSIADFGSGAQSHCVAYAPGGEHLLVTTKGANAVQQLLQSQAGMLSGNTPASVASAGAPRHIAVHSGGKLAFVVAESGSTITTYQLSSDGKLTDAGSVSSLPAGYDAQNTGAHVELSADGHVLYASNRGHDSIAVFSVNQESGALTLIEHEPSRGMAPHDFDLDPKGKLLVAGHRRSGNLTVFAIAADGSLSPLGEPVPTREDVTAVLIHYPVSP
jgi:6-phosphogluconolactonase